MPRPKRPRHIDSPPPVRGFHPEGGLSEAEVVLSLEEFEAIRLVDHLGMDQGQAADIMAVSRQTVGRILRSGRFKLARFLVEGSRLRLGGGCYHIRGQGRGHRRGQGHPGCRRQEPPAADSKADPEVSVTDHDL